MFQIYPKHVFAECKKKHTMHVTRDFEVQDYLHPVLPGSECVRVVTEAHETELADHTFRDLSMLGSNIHF